MSQDHKDKISETLYYSLYKDFSFESLGCKLKGRQKNAPVLYRSFGLLEPIRGGQGIAVTPILTLTPSDALSCLHFSDFELALLRITSNKNGEILTPSYLGCYDPLVASTP